MTDKQWIVVGILGVVAICVCGALGFAGFAVLANNRDSTQTAAEAPVEVPTTLPEQPADTPTPEATATTEPATDTPSPVPTATPENTPEPTATIEAVAPTEPPIIEPTIPSGGASIIIITVDKGAEVVTLQNVTPDPIDLSGWRLLSEKGLQNCNLNGVIQPNDTLQVWALAARIDQGGYNCGFDSNIWNNSETDPAVLFDQNGVEVYRVTCKTKVCP